MVRNLRKMLPNGESSLVSDDCERVSRYYSRVLVQNLEEEEVVELTQSLASAMALSLDEVESSLIISISL